MSLSPFVSFQSRFVTYLLTSPRRWPKYVAVNTDYTTVILCHSEHVKRY